MTDFRMFIFETNKSGVSESIVGPSFWFLKTSDYLSLRATEGATSMLLSTLDWS